MMVEEEGGIQDGFQYQMWLKLTILVDQGQCFKNHLDFLDQW